METDYSDSDFKIEWRAIKEIYTYPSFTESGRWRVDFSFDVKYDLPMDFYVRLGFSLNYDNRAIEGAAAVDYVL